MNLKGLLLEAPLLLSLDCLLLIGHIFGGHPLTATLEVLVSLFILAVPLLNNLGCEVLDVLTFHGFLLLYPDFLILLIFVHLFFDQTSPLISLSPHLVMLLVLTLRDRVLFVLVVQKYLLMLIISGGRCHMIVADVQRVL